MGINAEYKTELRKKYLVLEGQEESYQSRMLLNNRISGFLRVELREWNNGCFYYYDATDCVSLGEQFRKQIPGIHEIRALFQKIVDCCTEAEKYLLDEKDFLLDVAYIYVRENREIMLVCYPGYQREQGEQLSSLLESLMECVDYKNRRVVSLIYLLYSRSRQGECTVFQLLDLCDEIIAEEYGEGAEKEKGERLTSSQYRSEQRADEREGCVEGAKLSEKKEKNSVVMAVKNFGTAILERLQSIYGKKKASYEQKDEEREIQEMVVSDEVLETETVLLSEVVLQEEYHLEALENKQETIVMHSFPFYFGKDRTENGYCFQSNVISRKHACIRKEDESFYLVDLDSKNGTFLNGEQLLAQECRRLELGDVVGFADIYYIFTCSKPSNIL